MSMACEGLWLAKKDIVVRCLWPVKGYGLLRKTRKMSMACEGLWLAKKDIVGRCLWPVKGYGLLRKTL